MIIYWREEIVIRDISSIGDLNWHASPNCYTQSACLNLMCWLIYEWKIAFCSVWTSIFITMAINKCIKYVHEDSSLIHVSADAIANKLEQSNEIRYRTPTHYDSISSFGGPANCNLHGFDDGSPAQWIGGKWCYRVLSSVHDDGNRLLLTTLSQG